MVVEREGPDTLLGQCTPLLAEKPQGAAKRIYWFHLLFWCWER